MKTFLLLLSILVSLELFAGNTLSNIKILKMFKKPNHNSIECNRWNISKKNLEASFSNMAEVNMQDRYNFCYHLDCLYAGILQYNNQKYTFEASAAGYIEITDSKDVTKYFIQIKKDTNFLLICNCCEEID